MLNTPLNEEGLPNATCCMIPFKDSDVDPVRKKVGRGDNTTNASTDHGHLLDFTSHGGCWLYCPTHNTMVWHKRHLARSSRLICP